MGGTHGGVRFMQVNIIIKQYVVSKFYKLFSFRCDEHTISSEIKDNNSKPHTQLLRAFIVEKTVMSVLHWKMHRCKPINQNSVCASPMQARSTVRSA